MFNINIEEIINIAIEAGEKLLQYYKLPIQVEFKSDNSPVTIADMEAHYIIFNALAKLTPNIKIVSEENDEVENSKIRNDETFWIIDPLDGTRSFISHAGYFTVNIALIKYNKPILGVIYAPLTQELYYCNGRNSFKRTIKEDIILSVSSYANDFKIISGSAKTKPQILNKFKKYRIQSIRYLPSSIKFCYIADGSADIYPRFDNIMEWDTAAGQAIVEQAGGRVLTENMTRLEYGKLNFLNPRFTVTNGMI
ncbi:MAG: 3'(2'),5'-bisphosphate nucleotidase CysQ [Alphaproteobacteria bacterium]